MKHQMRTLAKVCSCVAYSPHILDLGYFLLSFDGLLLNVIAMGGLKVTSTYLDIHYRMLILIPANYQLFLGG